MNIELDKRMRRILNFLIGNIHLDMTKHSEQAEELSEIIKLINCEHEWEEWEEWEVKEDPICKKCGMCQSDIEYPKISGDNKCNNGNIVPETGCIGCSQGDLCS